MWIQMLRRIIQGLGGGLSRALAQVIVRVLVRGLVLRVVRGLKWRSVPRPGQGFVLVSFLLFLTLGQLPAQAAGADAPTTAQLTQVEAYVREQVKATGIPGLAYAIVHGDQIADAKGIGVADKERGVPVSPETIYDMGSVTKAMTAVAVLQLQERGLLELDAPVQRYLPWFRVADDQASAQITVRHLLTHSAGIHRLEGDAVVWQDPQAIRPSPELAVRALQHVPISAEPGTQALYCNICYDTLGLIVTHVSGEPYQAYLQRHLLEPLGMTRTYLNHAQLPAEGVARQYGFFFGFPAEATPWRGFIRSGFDVASGGDGYSTVLDLARFAASQLGAGPQVLSAEALAESQSGYPPIPGMTTGGYRRVKEISSTEAMEKDGDGFGAGADLLLMPEKRLAVVLLVGENNPSQKLAIAHGIAQILLGEAPVQAADYPNEMRLIGLVILAIALSGVGLMLWWFLAIRRAHRGNSRRRWWIALVRAGLVLPATLGLVWVVARYRPSPIGFFGYPLDLAISLALLLTALGLWSGYSVLTLIRGTAR